MTTTILLLLVEGFTVAQAPAPCGNTPQHPCYMKPAEPEKSPFIRSDAGVTFMVPGDATVNWLRTSEGTVVSPQCLCRCERETAVQVQDERAMCKLAIEAQQEQDHKGWQIIFGMLGLTGVLWGFAFIGGHIDKFAAAWRRSELPVKLILHWIAILGAGFLGTLLALAVKG